MNDYAGSVRSGTLLNSGLTCLHRLRKKAYDSLAAKDQWELTRCLEVLNLIDLGELVLISANERKETRGAHIRPDFPFTDPRLGSSLIIIKKVNTQIVTEWRKL